MWNGTNQIILGKIPDTKHANKKVMVTPKIHRYRNSGRIILTTQTTGPAFQAQQEFYQPVCCHLIACRDNLHRNFMQRIKHDTNGFVSIKQCINRFVSDEATHKQLSFDILPNSGGIVPVSLLPCRYLKQQTKVLRYKTEAFKGKLSHKGNQTYSFPVYDKFPSIGGIGPTSSFSLKSLETKQLIKSLDSMEILLGIRYLKIKQITYKTARACIKPITSGIFPVNLFP